MSGEDHIVELLPAYALGALDAEEASQVDAHLPVCPSCRAELRQIEAVTTSLPLALEEVAPPPSLEQELFARVAAPQAPEDFPQKLSYWRQVGEALRRHKAIAASLVVLLALVLVSLASNFLLWQQVNQWSAGPSSGEIQAIRLDSTGVIPGAGGYLTVSHDGLSGAIVLDRMPQLDEDQRYQVWLVKDGVRTSGALLSADELGYAAARVRPPQSLFNYVLLEVTTETAEGSPEPTTDVILSAPLFP